MSDMNQDNRDLAELEPKQHSDYKVSDGKGDEIYHLSGMFRSWFLDYASYVNLERAIPHINDGLKPVQRRVLYAMRRLDDGRYNKVANIVGHTMQFHPHGDASIGDALVNLGQKNLLVDCQGNWGNILTGDGAAAPRYIEARLTKFALEAVFNAKTTIWKPSYDGRNEEPVSLPVKFPLLLAQGAEGIGLGLNSRILPHNFGELCDASVACLRNEPFVLYPDFPTGGMLDVSKYNDGERGGKITIRARIEKIDNKTLKIIEVPYGVTSGKLIESIVTACEKGKIKVRKIEDNTSKNVEIRIHLEPKTSSDKTIDALYAFTSCQIDYSPNCCVVDDNKPCFISVSEVLRRSTNATMALLKRELEIERDELLEKLHSASLEKIFIEEQIYKDSEFEQAKNINEAYSHISKRLEPYKPDFIREITDDDLQRLLEIKMARILKFNSFKAEEQIAVYKDKIKDIDYKLEHLVEHTVAWFEHLKKSYASQYPRCTDIRNFDVIQATKVAEANEKLYFNRDEGFVGIALKRDDNAEFISNCSDIDDFIVVYKDGKYKIMKVADKIYVGKNVLHVAVFNKNDKRTIYNIIYRDGKDGEYFIKRCAVSAVTRDREYDFTLGTPGSKIKYFTVNSNGEAETVKVELKKTNGSGRNKTFDKDFSSIAIKGRQSRGNLLSKLEVKSITLKQKGGSTLGGTEIYFDPDVSRLNIDGRGEYLGSFDTNDTILVITQNGEFYVTDFDLNNHYDDDILKIEKFSPDKVWTAILYDATQGYHYIKRFLFEPVPKRTSYLVVAGNDSHILAITDTPYPLFKVTFGGDDSFREPVTVDAEEFIGQKSYKAKGRRLSNYTVAAVEELEPLRHPEKNEKTVDVLEGVEIISNTPADDAESLADENGQLKLNFDDLD